MNNRYGAHEGVFLKESLETISTVCLRNGKAQCPCVDSNPYPFALVTDDVEDLSRSNRGVIARDSLVKPSVHA